MMQIRQNAFYALPIGVAVHTLLTSPINKTLCKYDLTCKEIKYGYYIQLRGEEHAWLIFVFTTRKRLYKIIGEFGASKTKDIIIFIFGLLTELELRQFSTCSNVST